MKCIINYHEDVFGEEKTHPKATLEKFTDVVSWEVDDPAKFRDLLKKRGLNPHKSIDYTKMWHLSGKNHRVEDGVIKKDVDHEQPFVDFSDEEMKKFVQEQTDMNNVIELSMWLGHMCIEVYAYSDDGAGC